MNRLAQIVASLPPASADMLANDRRKAAVYRGMLALMQHVDEIAAHADDELLELFQQLIRRAQDLELAHSLALASFPEASA